MTHKCLKMLNQIGICEICNLEFGEVKPHPNTTEKDLSKGKDLICICRNCYCELLGKNNKE